PERLDAWTPERLNIGPARPARSAPVRPPSARPTDARWRRHSPNRWAPRRRREGGPGPKGDAERYYTGAGDRSERRCAAPAPRPQAAGSRVGATALCGFAARTVRSAGEPKRRAARALHALPRPQGPGPPRRALSDDRGGGRSPNARRNAAG